MSDKPEAPFFERFDRFVKKLQGVVVTRSPNDKASEPEKRVFATFQDRVIASVIDMSVVYLLLQDVFRFITVQTYSFADVAKLQAALQARPESLTPLQSMRHQIESAYETGLFQLWLANSFAQSVVIGVILVLVWREFDTTLGKYIIGLEFAGKHGEGKPTTRDYIRRFLGFYLSMPVLMIGFALLGVDKEKRAWHDRIAGTTVIYAERGSVFRQMWNWLKRQLKSS